jgi:hypothetical protein
MRRARPRGRRVGKPSSSRRTPRAIFPVAMNENFSLVVMCLFLLGSLAFLAQQLTSYH